MSPGSNENALVQVTGTNHILFANIKNNFDLSTLFGLHFRTKRIKYYCTHSEKRYNSTCTSIADIPKAVWSGNVVDINIFIILFDTLSYVKCILTFIGIFYSLKTRICSFVDISKWDKAVFVGFDMS